MGLGDPAPQVDEIADLLEREEADAERQRDRERPVIEPGDGREGAEKEVEILEGAENREVGDDARGEPRHVAGAAELLRGPPV